MATKNKKSTKKLSFRKTSPLKMLLAVVVVSAVAGIGTYLLFRSHAATVGPRMFMAASNTTTDATFTQFNFGIFGDRYVAGDWDANKSDTLGVYRPSNSTFFLTNSNSDAGVTGFQYGNSGDIPIAGDWNGDGTTTVGVYRPTTGKFYLRNSNSTDQAGVKADVETLMLGNLSSTTPDKVPIACDWNGDGITDLGLFRTSTAEWETFVSYGQQANAPWIGYVATFIYGNPGDKPVCGDWDSNKTATPGVYRDSNSTFYLKNTNDGAAGWPQRFGQLGWLPLVGRWTGTTKTLIGAYSLGGATIPNPVVAGGVGSTPIVPCAGDLTQNTVASIKLLQTCINSKITVLADIIDVDGVAGSKTKAACTKYLLGSCPAQYRTDTPTVVGPLSATLPTLAANMAGAPENKDDPVKYCQALSAAILKVVQNADAIEAIFDVRWKPGSNSLWRNGVGTTIGTRLYWRDKTDKLTDLRFADCTKRSGLADENIKTFDQAKALKGQLNNAYGTLLAKILLGQ